jgi:ribonuclease P protein component
MRLGRESEFARVYAEGSRARGAWLTVAAVENGLPLTRLGLSVGRRYEKRAVRRNAWKRRLREAFRLSYAEMPPGFDLVVIASEPGARAALTELRAELVKLAAKAARRRAEKRRGTSP